MTFYLIQVSDAEQEESEIVIYENWAEVKLKVLISVYNSTSNLDKTSKVVNIGHIIITTEKSWHQVNHFLSTEL